MAETTFVRTHKDRNYTVLDNTFIRDVTLSWKAKGVMTYLLSLPDDWSVNFSEVLRHSADGETALKSTIKELKEHGYLVSRRLQSSEGKFIGFTYEIIENPESSNHQVEKPSGGKPTEWINHRVENDQLLNTNNTKYINKQNTNSINSEEENHNLLSPQREVIGWYYECWSEMYKRGAVASEKPFLNGQQAARLIQGHIKNGLSVSQLKTAIKNAMDDNWLVSQGYSLTIILSASQMNKLLNAKQTVSKPAWANKRPALANQVTEEDINF